MAFGSQLYDCSSVPVNFEKMVCFDTTLLAEMFSAYGQWRLRKTLSTFFTRGGRRRGSLNSQAVASGGQVLPKLSSCELYQYGSSSHFQTGSCCHIGHTWKPSCLGFQPPFQGQFLFQKVFSQLKVQGSCAETLPFSWHIFLRLRDSSSSSILLMSHLPWCPRKMRRRSQHWGWSWRSVPCWPAPGRKPCTASQVIMKR